ncbi:MAG TPA: HNH endonuclease signature motif containing protein [Streptosporangiaceae bacterium]|nr:HNH endonuclease signature motif containing protein [Streptosporangiaceae bacterium]
MSHEPLPEPESEQLAALLGDGAARLVYGLLCRRKSNPPTADEIGYFLSAAASAGTSTDRVIRNLRTHFDIAGIVRGDGERYELRGWVPHHLATGVPVLSLRRRAQALAPGLCVQCGKSPLKDGVRLEVDLMVPPEWGGTTDPENLRPLCEDCFNGKRQYLETYASYSEQIRHAASFDEPQRRIGELLLALQDEWVPSELIGIVASAREFQTDYERRIRELRTLGWEYQSRRAYGEGARVRVYYRLIRAAAWPENIHAAITAAAKRRKADEETRPASSDGAQ